MTVDRFDRVFALIGHPVVHSCSPVMHNRALKNLGLSACYLSFDIGPGELPAAVAAFRTLGFQGFNVTIPYKQKIIPLLDQVDETAGEIGAVNTVVNRGGRLVGYNTDAPGFLNSLRLDAGFDCRGKSALLLGAGGAARAVAYALLSGGLSLLLISDRNSQLSAVLASDLNRRFASATQALPLEEVPVALGAADLLVNATPVGMFPHCEETPLADPGWLRPGLVVYDLIYNPEQTRLMREAEEAGCQSCGGLGMLVRQGALALEMWTGAEAPVAVMRKAAQDALAGGMLSRS